MKTVSHFRNRFGVPNPAGAGYLVTIDLPYPMRLAWDKNQIVRKITCHKEIAEPLKAVFSDILKHYGLDKIRDLEDVLISEKCVGDVSFQCIPGDLPLTLTLKEIS